MMRGCVALAVLVMPAVAFALGPDDFARTHWTLSVLAGAASAECPEPFDAIAASHIDANVPAPGDFDRFLRRDLEAYFRPKVGGGLLEVKYELLREGPTQSGIAYPKFYAWVQVRENGRLLRDGAVRLAAIERLRFEITDFVSAEEVRRSPDSITRIFPAPVCDRIRAKVGLR